MKLHAVEAARIVGHGGHRAIRCVRNGHKALRRARHLIGMAHPAGALGPETCQQAAVYSVHGHIGTPVFAARAALHRRAQQVRHQLHAVADAQNRHAQLKYALVHPGRALIQHAGRASAENDAHGLDGPDIRQLRAAGQHAGIDPALTYTPGNQLGVLAAKVQNQNALRSFHKTRIPSPSGCRGQTPTQQGLFCHKISLRARGMDGADTPFWRKGQNPGERGPGRRLSAARDGPGGRQAGPGAPSGRTGNRGRKTAGAEPSSLCFFPLDTHFQTCYLYKAVRAARRSRGMP